MNAELLNVSDLVFAAVLNGTWQGCIIVLVVALSLRLFGRVNAATRHAIWFCTLLIVTSLVVVHCLIALLADPHPGSTSNEVAATLDRRTELNSAVDKVALASSSVTGSESAGFAYEHHGTRETRSLLVPNRPLHSFPSTPTIVLKPGSDRVGESILLAADDPIDRGHVGLAAAENRGREEHLSTEARRGNWLASLIINPASVRVGIGTWIPRTVSVSFLGLWLLAAAIRACMLIVRLFRIRHLKQSAVKPNAEMRKAFEAMVTRLRIRRPVRLSVSATERNSILLGFFRPVVLLPAGQPLRPEELDFVLRHELAHVKRGDDWANLIQHIVLAAIPFHPTVWWISRKLSLEREVACDDHVLHQGGQPRAYALLLTDLAARLRTPMLSLAPGASNNRTQLQERIHMILDRNRDTSPRLAKASLTFISSSAALLAIGIVGSMPRIVFAQNQPARVAVTEVESVADVPATAPAGTVNAVPSHTDFVVPLVAARPAQVPAGPKPKQEQRSHETFFATSAAGDYQINPEVPSTPPTFVTPLSSQPTSAGVAEPVPNYARTGRTRRSQATDDSVEERLARLERMVEELMSQRSARSFAFPDLDGQQTYPDAAEYYGRYAKAKGRTSGFEDAPHGMDELLEPHEVEEIVEHAHVDAMRALDEAAAASEDARKLAEAAQAQALNGLFEQHLKALHQQLEALDRQREDLHLQIEELEHRKQESSDDFKPRAAGNSLRRAPAEEAVADSY